MKKVIIKLNTFEDIKEFNKLCCTFESDIDVTPVGTRYIIDAKSLLGLLSLNFTKPIEVIINAVNEDEYVRFVCETKKYEV